MYDLMKCIRLAVFFFPSSVFKCERVVLGKAIIRGQQIDGYQRDYVLLVSVRT